MTLKHYFPRKTVIFRQWTNWLWIFKA